MPPLTQPTAAPFDGGLRERANHKIAVFGASGHTGRFVVSELQRRGMSVILAGRDEGKLKTLGSAHPRFESRVASIDEPLSLDRAVSGASLVINCAGPFVDTAVPLMETALRARIHYVDIAAEQGTALAAFEQFSDLARDARVLIVPSMAFYGGLGDLLATAAMGDWPSADEIGIAVALDSWKPTRGTRLTGHRNPGRRFVFSGNRLTLVADPRPQMTWNFPAPFGMQDVAAFPLAETVVISRHIHAQEVYSHVTVSSLEELRNPSTPAPTPVDESGRSAQQFLMDVIVRRGDEQQRATAAGRDIYAITAPLVAEAVERVLRGPKHRGGTVAPGQIFDAKDFLETLSPQHLSFILSKRPRQI
jgi:uncharacterized protein YbjT (DUF2867 family)